MSTWSLEAWLLWQQFWLPAASIRIKRQESAAADVALDAAAAVEPVTVIISPMPEQDLPHERRG